MGFYGPSGFCKARPENDTFCLRNVSHYTDLVWRSVQQNIFEFSTIAWATFIFRLSKGFFGKINFLNKIS